MVAKPNRTCQFIVELYHQIQKAYNLTQDLRNIFEKTTDKIIGFAKLAKWHEKVNQSGFKSFNTISRTIINHYQTILNYFDNRSSNASAEMKFMNSYKINNKSVNNLSMPKQKRLEHNLEVLEI